MPCKAAEQLLFCCHRDPKIQQTFQSTKDQKTFAIQTTSKSSIMKWGGNLHGLKGAMNCRQRSKKKSSQQFSSLCRLSDFYLEIKTSNIKIKQKKSKPANVQKIVLLGTSKLGACNFSTEEEEKYQLFWAPFSCANSTLKQVFDHKR